MERTAAPLYQDVRKAIERAIFEGLWKPGDQIPTEAELERQFSASRGTLRSAISELVRAGWLHRQAGRGTFVIGPSFQSLERFFRYETIADPAPMDVRNELLEQRMVPASADVARALQVEPGSEVAYVGRRRFHQEEPFLVTHSYFPPAVWEDVAEADFTTSSLYGMFKTRFALYVVWVDEYLRADLVSPDEAGLLGIPERSAVIRLERTAHTFENRPIEFRHTVGRADRFRYHVRLD